MRFIEKQLNFNSPLNQLPYEFRSEKFKAEVSQGKYPTWNLDKILWRYIGGETQRMCREVRNKLDGFYLSICEALRVLTKSIAIVIGPTPPGTGDIAAAFRDTPSKSTSPASR